MVWNIKRVENWNGEIFGDLDLEFQIDIGKKEELEDAYGDYFTLSFNLFWVIESKYHNQSKMI